MNRWFFVLFSYNLLLLSEYKWHGPCIPSGSDLIPNVPHRNQKLETVEQSPENQGEMSGRRSRKRRRSEAIETALDQISEEVSSYF